MQASQPRKLLNPHLMQGGVPMPHESTFSRVLHSHVDVMRTAIWSVLEQLQLLHIQLIKKKWLKLAQTYTRRRRSVSTGSGRVSTASRTVMKIDMDEELAKKVFEEEQAKAMAEQEQERINFEAALELQK
ncbi:hypothetical protein Tco_0649676 [Tanacetum coccineum]